MNTYMSPPPALVSPLQGFHPDREIGGDGGGTPIGRLGNVLRRRWLLLLCCAMAAATAVGGLGLRTPRQYTAWAQIVITPQAPQAAAATGLNERGGEDAMMTIETQVSIIQSRDLMSQVLARLLAMPGFPILEFGREGKAHRLARLLTEKLERATADSWISAELGPEWATGLRSFAALPNPRQRREMIIDEMLRNLKVNSEPRSRVVSARYTATSPELAALIVNTVFETYTAMQRSNKSADIRLELERLDKELPALAAELQAANMQTRAYRLEHAIPEANVTDTQEQQAVALKAALKAVDADLARTKVDRAALARLRDDPLAPVPPRFSTALDPLQDEARRLEQHPSDPNAPPSPVEAAAPDGERATIRDRIVAQADLGAVQASDEAALLTQRRQMLQKQLDDMLTSLGEIQPAADHLKELLRLADAKRQLLEDKLLRQQRLLQNQDLVSADAYLLSAAAPPQKPTSASPILFLPPALVAGLLIGGLIAIWRDAVDDGLRSERLVPHALGIPCAGFLPSRPGRRKVSAALPAGSLYAAALRLVFNAAIRPPTPDGCRSILLTSSVSGEGGGRLAEDMALYAARLVPGVLLIELPASDASLFSQASERWHRWPDGSILTSPIPGMILTQPFDDCGLHMLRSESHDPDVVCLLASRDLPQSMSQLREAYDCIVIHAGPVLEAPGARLLAGEVDHTLVAVRWGHTPQRLVENALAVLCGIGNGPGKLVSAVLTEVNVRRHLTYRFGDAIEALVKAYGRRARA